MPDTSVQFYQVRIQQRYGPTVNDVYIAIRNNRSSVQEALSKFDRKTRDRILSLISRMATVQNYKSELITWNLKGYNIGEITPHPHRFFFFQKCGNNIIFFEYIKKKRDSLGDPFYKRLNELKIELENEFKKYLQRAE